MWRAPDGTDAVNATDRTGRSRKLIAIGAVFCAALLFWAGAQWFVYSPDARGALNASLAHDVNTALSKEFSSARQNYSAYCMNGPMAALENCDFVRPAKPTTCSLAERWASGCLAIEVLAPLLNDKIGRDIIESGLTQWCAGSRLALRTLSENTKATGASIAKKNHAGLKEVFFLSAQRFASLF